jgi:hypothetical protein
MTTTTATTSTAKIKHLIKCANKAKNFISKDKTKLILNYILFVTENNKLYIYASDSIGAIKILVFSEQELISLNFSNYIYSVIDINDVKNIKSLEDIQKYDQKRGNYPKINHIFKSLSELENTDKYYKTIFKKSFIYAIDIFSVETITSIYNNQFKVDMVDTISPSTFNLVKSISKIDNTKGYKYLNLINGNLPFEYSRITDKKFKTKSLVKYLENLDNKFSITFYLDLKSNLNYFCHDNSMIFILVLDSRSLSPNIDFGMDLQME